MSQISDTAFLVNWSKAQNPNLSKDPWAHLWVTDKSATFAQEFTRKVSPGHPLAPALRNRFFVEALQSFEKKVSQFTLINIAAGFTSYPYVIGFNHPVIEIDLPHVVAYRKTQGEKFEAAGKLPKRKIQFVAMDLNSPQTIEQIRTLIQQAAQPCFVLMEGILYYLKQAAVDALFNLFNTQLPSHSQVGFVTWPPRNQNSTTMKALKNFFEVKLGFPKQHYTWLEDNYVQQWKHLCLLEQTNYVQLEQKYSVKPYQLTLENTVSESVFLMEKK